MNKRSIGKKGEDIAKAFLLKKGYLILEENAHERWGEIDLIAHDVSRNEVVFVEVKLRNTRCFGRPEEGVPKIKLSHLIQAARRWINKQKKEVAWRIDIIGIEYQKEKMEIRHLENITME